MSHDPVQHYKDLFAQQQRAQEPAWLQKFRQSALERFVALGFPTRKHEEWKYTPIRPISRVAFGVRDAAKHTLSVEALESLVGPAQETTRLVLVEGHLISSLSHVEDLPEGVSLRSMREAIAESKEQEDSPLQKQLGLGVDRIGDNPFDALNLAFFTDGFVLDVPKNTVVEKPIEVVYVGLRGDAPQMGTARSVVTVATGAEATLIERFVSVDLDGADASGEHLYFTNTSTAFDVAPNASVKHYKVQRDHEQAFSMAFTWFDQKRDSRASNLAISLGAKIARNEVTAVLDGQGIETTLDGLYLSDGERFIDNRTFLDHAKPHCNSFETYKGILNQRGKGTFNGKILVRQDAQKTDAKQSNQALLLSDDATVYSKPQLEIYADDVKCTHGATTGFLDEKSLYYARSRGIGEQEARGLLTYAFANELVETIEVPWLRQELARYLAQRFQLPHLEELTAHEQLVDEIAASDPS